MKFHKLTTLNGSPDQVRELLLDPRFREEVALAAGSQSATVTVDEKASGAAHVAIDSRQSTQGLPAAAIKFIGPELAIRQDEEWGPTDSGTLSVTVGGLPGKVDGRITLREDGGSTAYTVDADITVKIFMIGSKVEKVIGDILGNVLTLQAEAGNRHLAQ